MSDHRPIQRHQALIPLSKDHHFGLLLAWKIRQGLNNNIEADRISNYVLYFYSEELEPHFKEEEQFLFPLLPASDPLRVQAENEHTRLRSLVNEIAANKSDGALLPRFADELQSHIRFEERVLFNHLQQMLPGDDLSLRTLTAEIPRKDIDADWYDIFWKREHNSL